MILQRLHDDYDRILQQTGQKEEIPSMYEMKPLRWILRIPAKPDDPPAAFLPQIGTDPNPKKADKGMTRPLPSTKRTIAITPLLLADTPAYTLGLIFPDDLKGKDEAKERERATDKFTAFKQLAHTCASATGDANVAAIAAFLEIWNPDNPAVEMPPEMNGSQTITFQVGDDGLPIEQPAVQSFWASGGKVGAEATPVAIQDGAMQCLLSGRLGAVEEIMPVPVKGIPGGQPTGTHLVSGNFAAVESYGLKRAQTSPISRDAGERFGKALNALLASPSHRLTLQSVAFVFWAAAAATPTILVFQLAPDISAVRGLLDAVKVGRQWCDIPNAAKFHLFGLSANVARAVVRTAIETTIGAIGQAQAEWFQKLAIIGPDGEDGAPLGLKQLAVCGYREFKDIPPNVEDALIEAALYGRRLPESLLQAVVARCRVGTRVNDSVTHVTYARAALIKYFLIQDQDSEDTHTMQEEVTGELPDGNAAYHCGRLFAELEDIQKQALPGINATIGDKYFGSASSSPASVFGILLAGAQNHLSSLRKSREGAFHGAQKRLEEILAQIDDFPKTLPLKDQARFSLGYYHHRAAKRKDIAERSAAKKRGGQITLDEVNEDNVQ